MGGLKERKEEPNTIADPGFQMWWWLQFLELGKTGRGQH